MTKQAKLFASGGSQAVRLPAEFRFQGDRVYVRRDSRTGDVILSNRPHATWREFMAFRAQLGPLEEDFLSDRAQGVEQRQPFTDWRE